MMARCCAPGSQSKKPRKATTTKRYLVVPPIEGEDADDKRKWDDNEDEDTDESSDDSDPGLEVNPVYKSKAKPLNHLNGKMTKSCPWPMKTSVPSYTCLK